MLNTCIHYFPSSFNQLSMEDPSCLQSYDPRLSAISRMDDPESEGEIQEYKSLGGNNGNGNGKLSWMVRFGKKVLVTGLVISSAPFVLPPLVAISVIGLACSVPYGVFLVSSACTETLMNRLLPMPSPTTSPLLMEYRKSLDGEEADWDEKLGEQDDDGMIVGGIDMEREEEEFKEDVVEEIEMRIGLVDEEKEGFDGNEKDSMDELATIVEEDGEVLDEGEERPSQSFEVEVKEISESNAGQPVIDEGHCFEAVIGGSKKSSSNIEMERPLEVEYVEENKELLGRHEDENTSDYTRDDNRSIEKVDAQMKPTKATEETTKGKQRRKRKGKGKGRAVDIEKQLPKQEERVHEVSGVLGGLEGSEKNDSNMEETPAVELVQAIDVEENEKLVIGARGLSERIGDEGKTDSEGDDKRQTERVKDIEVTIVGTTGVEVEQDLGGESMSGQPIEDVCSVKVEFEGDVKNDNDKEDETPFQIKNVAVQSSQSTDIGEDEESVRGTRGLLERIRDEGKTDYPLEDKPVTETRLVDEEKDAKKTVGGVRKAKSRRRRKQTSELEPKVEESKAAKEVQMKESEENLDAASKEMKVEKGNKGLTEKMDDNKNDVEQKYPLNKEKTDAIFSNEDDREINKEKELDMLEDLSTVSQQGSPSDMNTLEETLPSSSYSIHQEMSESPELPVSTKVQESDDTQTSAENAIAAASDEALYSEEKIWEKINALRTIVGYKAARQHTSIEELKALYLFTGIEPPPSFKDTSDLVEVNARLRFLMSVVGVK